MAVDRNTLPDDPALLKQVIEDLTTQLDQLHKQVHFLTRQLFGRKSETVDPRQLWLDHEEIRKLLGSQPPPPIDEAPSNEQANSSQRTGHGRRPIPAHLRRERIEIPDPEGACTCPQCGAAREVIGEESSERVEWVPASLFVQQFVRKKWACRQCEGNVVIAELPPQPIDKGMAGPGLLAQVITSKYADHLPLNRQIGIFARHGMEFSIETLCGWIGSSAALLEPLYLAMKTEVLSGKIINTDETIVPVLDRTRDRTRRGRLWVYLGDDEHRYVVYDFTPDRSSEGPEAFLDEWEGYLQADAYTGYDVIFAKGKIVEVGCWAHARRKFFDARTSDSTRSAIAIAFIHDLYEVERGAKDLDPEMRLQRRIKQSKPLLERFEKWFEGEVGRVLPKSPIGEAIEYVRNQWTALTRYVEDGRLAIDNNAAERALRAIVVGRKNWMFAGSDEGGRRAAILFSIVASCKQRGIDPFVYLKDVLDRVSTHPNRAIAELVPGRWSPAAAQPPPT